MTDIADAVSPSDGSQPTHIPVLLDALLALIQLPHDGIMVDATVGFGGHSAAFGQQLSEKGLLIGLDVDPTCLKIAKKNLAGLRCKVECFRENFDQLERVLSQLGIEKVDFILADLGVCSGQWDDIQRGLSFQKPMPLDMRLDNRLTTTAADLVNRLPQKDLADLIYQYGQDRASRRIARFIVQARQHQPIQTTDQLAEIVRRAVKPSPRCRIHPATRTFQALRIAVNDELTRLERLLNTAPNCLKSGGIIAVISFHSLEDQRVKQNFKQNQALGIYEVLTRKPIQASEQEIHLNPRSRSAKLRIAKRI